MTRTNVNIIACKLMVKFKLGMEPLQVNLHHTEGADATKTCKLCNNDTEDAKHFLFVCPILIAPREKLRTELSMVYCEPNVMNSNDVGVVVNPPPDSDITKLANVAKCVYEMLRTRAIHLPNT